jgi:DHA1 family bicyclomycin/chloramphenicol resistance-like MFS transporter
MTTGGPATPSAYQPNAKYVLLLGLMCALPAVTSDIYLPSLPEVARDLHTTTTAVQLTMTGVLVGGAVGQLVVGPLSDRFGRRRPMLIGIALHIVIWVWLPWSDAGERVLMRPVPRAGPTAWH